MSTNRFRNLKQIEDHRGVLGIVESADLPFSVRRFFWITDVPSQERRGGHAHLECEQFVVCLRGEFIVSIDTGHGDTVIHLLKAGESFHLKKMEWLEMSSFAQASVALVAASHEYDESDYLRDYEDFLRRVTSP